MTRPFVATGVIVGSGTGDPPAIASRTALRDKLAIPFFAAVSATVMARRNWEIVSGGTTSSGGEILGVGTAR